ncbi:hypothetical protein CEUSTIGMA_g4098.t1 [Chlamydomonas eustigma]|uniref:Alpha-type protein kinase domain-containing protein n=1 Tax=Chlamydomonas eustigma TaxID=1157962 RepID=A0A250X188_9CHLO|nr:hypothetical protein CEUSTIGMA_g4098.t1 [Chlamydomonas eustigma]|eukprot:GAX76652.1 hypothetical protein CEUSTIGMA_g4098.t1 [Chlamydomonas eustigma]
MSQGGTEVLDRSAVYRDYSDNPNVEVFDFSSDLSQFSTFVRSIQAKGGADQCEDVFSGLESLAKLSWKSQNQSSKVIFHLADAPCHGRRFHDDCGDDYPGGDKLGHDICKLLHDLSYGKSIGKYSFSHINSTTKKMIQQFKLCVGGDKSDWIMEDTIGSDTAKLTTHVTRAITASVSESMSTASKALAAGPGGGKARIYTINKEPAGSINWASRPLLKGVRIKHILPSSVADLLESIDAKDPLLEETKKPYFMKVAANVFADDGGCRLPYYARLSTICEDELSDEIWVVKLSRSLSEKSNSLEAYKDQMETQSVASALALFFVDAVGKKVQKIHYTMVNTFVGREKDPVETSSRMMIFNFERFIEGGDEICKFNSNFGHVNLKEYVAVVQAFSHWTYHITGKKLMVVDVQGIWDSKRKQYVLFDPAVHCSCDVLRFGNTNLGIRGMDKFFMTHSCNSVCKSLGLPRHPMQPLES